MKTLNITRRQTATVIAALRYWQEDQKQPFRRMSHSDQALRSEELMEIATGEGEFENLSAKEIDTLAERINR